MALTVVFSVCVCVCFPFFQGEWQSSVVLYSEVFAMDPCSATEEYMCSAGVAHLPPLTGGETMQSNLLGLGLNKKEPG